MAESKFLKFQDVDRDGVIDVCDDDLTTPELPCKGPCTPDPMAIIPNWKKKNVNSPFLNTKICHFQITKVTPYQSTTEPLQPVRIGESVSGIETTDEDDMTSGILGRTINTKLEQFFKQFELEVINNLLDFCELGARLNNEETRKIVRKSIQYKKYDLDARPGSQLKLLYSVPFDIIYNLADAPEVPEREEEEEGLGWESVTYKGDMIMTDALRVRKGLHFYSKLLKVSAALGEGDAYFVDSFGDPTHKFYLDDYGDPAIFSDGLLKGMINDLKSFLATKGKSLPDGGAKGDIFGPIFREKVTKIEFKFKNKKLRVLKVYTEECGDKPSIYNKRSGALRKLCGSIGDPSTTFKWNDQTLVNYFINLSKMSRRLNSRVEQPWREFLETYTYPQIKVVKYPIEKSLGTCVGDALGKEAKEFGQDVLDSIFGLGDLVAYLYNDTLCRDKVAKVIQDEEEMNRLAPDNPESPFGKEVAGILAKNQRWAKLAADDDVVLRMCIASFADFVDGAGELASKVSTPKGGKPTIPVTALNNPGVPGTSQSFKGLFEEGLNGLKLCGLLDLLFDAFGCLLGGLSFDDALPIIIKKALDAMGIEQFGELFVGLPPEQQDKMDRLVKQKMEESKRRTTNRDERREDRRERAAQGDTDPLISSQLNQLEIPEALKFGRPWDNPAIIAAERSATNPANLNNYEGVVPPTYQETMNEMTAGDRTILSQLDSVGNGQAGRDAPVNEIMTAYIEALIEVYSDNLILIIDELGKFPGAPLIRDIMALTPLACPRPPLFNPGIDDFLKSLDLAFCRKVKEIQIPSFNQPLELKISFKDLLDPLFRVARFVAGMIIIIVVNKIVAKVCEILTRAVCKALETTGDLLLGLPGAIAGTGPSLKQIIRENICGEDVDEQTLDDSIVDMMSILGLGPQAFADRDKTIAFANDLSLGVTRQEFADALLGRASEEFLESADQLLEYVHTDFRDALPNKTSIGRFAKSIGNFLPLEYREVLINYSNNSLGFDDGTPANPSVCSTPEQIQRFKDLRLEILGDRATKEQIEQMYCDLRDDNLSDLELVSEILEKGVGPYVADQIPNLLSTPGCDDGLLPYEPIQTTNVSLGFTNSVLDALENDYLDDMMGTGFTFFGSGDRNFGFLTMILSDTKGYNLRAHHRKADARNDYVDFAANISNGGEGPGNGLFAFFKRNVAFDSQEGQYPYFVAEWMKRQFLNAGLGDGQRNKRLKPGFNLIKAGGNDLRKSLNFESTNTATVEKEYKVDLEDLGYSNVFGRQGISTFTLPDFGYNTVVGGINRSGINFFEGVASAGGVGAAGYGAALGGALLGAGAVGAAITVAGPIIAGGAAVSALSDSLTSATTEPLNTMSVIRMPRKGRADNPGGIRGGRGKQKYDKNGADICLDFRDNALGTRKGLNHGTNPGGNPWSYGYEVQCYYSDIEYKPGTKVLRNRPDDNIRVQIVEKVNYGSPRKFASPIAKQLTAEETKLPPFDLPNWIENIPILGWALENMMNLILLGFRGIVSGILALTAYSGSDAIKRFRKFEFISVDDSLDAFEVVDEPNSNNNNSLDINNFPNYARAREVLVPGMPPQVAVLADLIGSRTSASLKKNYDEIMEKYYKDFSKMIGENNSGWLYGATFDFLTEDDYEYGVRTPGGEFLPYDDAGYDNEDMVLGISRNEFNLGRERARVIYLDPMVFGGSYEHPPLHVKPQKYSGWWGLTQAFFPGDTACKPHGKNLIDFDEIKNMTQRYYSTLEEDVRLYSDVECVRQVPFDRILPRSAKIGMYTLILAAIRIYASTHIMKSVGTFSVVQPKFPDNFSSIYSAYIVERMEEDFKDAQPAFWEAFNVFKDEEFWYGFLEQSVECYDFLVSAGELDEPVRNGYLQRAADTINNLQTNYAYAYRTGHERTYTNEDGQKKTQRTPGLWEAKFTGDAGFFESLRGYRERKNFEGIKSVEDSAKLILQELVNYELTKMGEKFTKNMQDNGFNPKIFDLNYWIFENKCVGSEIKYVGPKIIESPIDLPSKRNPDPSGAGINFPGPYYTAGGQFRVAVDKNEDDEFSYAQEYIGYYHIHMDDDGNEIYMAGAVHSDDAHDILTPVADGIQISTVRKQIIEYSPDIASGEPGSDPTQPIEITEETVGIGNVPPLGAAGSSTTDKPFKIEYYVRVGGAIMSPSEAKSTIFSNPPDNFLSDHYPGSLKIITNEQGVEIGIEGNLGVRHGLRFSYMNQPVTSVEVDALDFKVKQFQTMRPSSKLLHCLLQKLIHDPKYKLLTGYVFSIKKVTGTLAIYNDMGFLASVGEVTVGEDDAKFPMNISKRPKPNAYNRVINPDVKSDWISNDGDSLHTGIKAKPGTRIWIKQNTVETSIPFSRGPSPEKERYGLPNYWDDDLDFETTSYDANASALTGNEGWMHASDRPNFTPFTLTWDEWDRILLRNSRARIKKMFRIHYYAASDKPGDKSREPSATKIKLRNLKARLFPSPGAGVLPWWQKGRLRENPYNANGDLCDGPDILD